MSDESITFKQFVDGRIYLFNSASKVAPAFGADSLDIFLRCGQWCTAAGTGNLKFVYANGVVCSNTGTMSRECSVFSRPCRYFVCNPEQLR